MIVCRPYQGSRWSGSLVSIKACGGRYVPERKCWVVPEDDRDILDATIVGEDPDTLPSAALPTLLAAIDRCADLT